MAGHSHWAGIKHKKGRADKQRSKIFSKLSKAHLTSSSVLPFRDAWQTPNKLCKTEEEAKETVSKYEEEFKEGKSPYDTPYYYLNEETTIKSWLFTVDHKRIVLMYLFAIMFFFAVGGFLALMMRLELLTPAGGDILDKNALGFHKSGMWSKVIDIDKCYLQTNISNKIRNYTKRKALELNLEFFDLKNQNGDIRNLMIRTTTTNEIMVLIQFYKYSKKAENLLELIKNEFDEITSIMYVINSKPNDTIYDLEIVCFSGKNYITEKISELLFKISAKSFFQTNPYQTSKLYNIVKRFANLKGNEIVYDLYSGIGAISLLSLIHI